MPEVLNVVMRWLHITSMATLVGGFLYGRLVMSRTDAPSAIEEQAAARFRPLVLASVGGLTLSGIYNILSNPGHSPHYHMFLGIKLLLVLHIFAVGILIVKPSNQKRARMMTGTLISGLVVILISAYLRRIF